MKNRNNYSIAISLIGLIAALFFARPVIAGEVVGEVLNLSGLLFAEKSDGTLMTLEQGSGVETGDTLVTRNRAYARIKFIDDSTVTLRPNSQFVVKSFNFVPKRTEDDSSVLNLVKGGLRTITGQIGKRGDKEDYQMSTPAGIIGIRGTMFTVRICQDDCNGLENGVYFTVLEGAVAISNNAGTLEVAAGQTAFSRDIDTMPVIIPIENALLISLGNLDYPDFGGLDGDGDAAGCEVR